MFKSLVSLALVSALVLQGALAEFSVVTPSELVQCQPVTIQWSGAAAGPVDIIFVDPTNPCDSDIADLGTNNTGSQRTWSVALHAGVAAQLSLVDSAGNEAWSGDLTVKNSSDTSCFTSSTTSGKSSSSTSSSTATVAPTTLVVPANAAGAVTVPSSSSTPPAVPVGAANAGDNPNGASAFASFSAPVIAISTLAAIFLSTSL